MLVPSQFRVELTSRSFASISSASVSTCALSDLLAVVPAGTCSTSLPLLKAETPLFHKLWWSLVQSLLTPGLCNHKVTTSPVQSDFVLWVLFCEFPHISLCGNSLAVYTCVTGIVYSEHCTTLVCNTCWVGWEHYISHCFKITNDLELSALIEVWVCGKRLCPLKLCVDLGITHSTTALLLIF